MIVHKTNVILANVPAADVTKQIAVTQHVWDSDAILQAVIVPAGVVIRQHALIAPAKVVIVTRRELSILLVRVLIAI